MGGDDGPAPGAFSLEDVVGLMDGLGHLADGVAGAVLHGVTARRRLEPAFDELPLVRAQETVLAGSSMPYVEWLTASGAEDPVWRLMRLGQALDRVDVPVLLQGGWQDRFLDQMIEQYERLRGRGVDVGLTIGPWTHAGLATKGAGIVTREALDWLSEHLAGAGSRQRPSPVPVRIYVAGAQERRYPPLTETLEVIGNPVVEVVHQTDNPHADLFARLCEVAANGRSINVSDGFRRLDPEKASGTIRLQLEATAHRFTPGARIRLQLSGGAHPRYARNLGTDQDPATSSDLAPSRRKIFHGDGGFSRLLLPCPTRRRGGPAGRSAQDARGARLGEWGRRWR